MSPSIKEIVVTYDNVLPPNLAHKYFEDAKNHPFRPKETSFSLVNAWWLAESSLLAYAAPADVHKKFEDTGVGTTKYFQKSGGSTQCFVLYGNEFIIVAFRGTQVVKNNISIFDDVITDLVTDAKVALVASTQGGNVHQGFKDALDEVWEDLLAFLNTLKNEKPERTVWFTGHSLGGALATLAADRYDHVQGLYTFGSPCVGDETFAADFNVNK